MNQIFVITRRSGCDEHILKTVPGEFSLGKIVDFVKAQAIKDTKIFGKDCFCAFRIKDDNKRYFLPEITVVSTQSLKSNQEVKNASRNFTIPFVIITGKNEKGQVMMDRLKESDMFLSENSKIIKTGKQIFESRHLLIEKIKS